MVRAATLLAVGILVGVYSALAGRFPALSDWGDVVFLGLVLIPTMFALVWIALPLRETLGPVGLGAAGVALALLAVLLSVADLEGAANLTKLAAATVLGWWFLSFFEAPTWVVLGALLIIPGDLYSVARGPTREITENQPQVFDALSVFMRIPGEETAAQLGLPDVLFFALFLGATARFALRTAPTWALMALSFGGTLAIAVGSDRAGVAALPLLSVAFVLVNADRLWRGRRTWSRTELSE